MPCSTMDAVTLVSKCTIFPSQKTSLSDLKLSVSDLPMLSTHYIQKGALFTRPHFSVIFSVRFPTSLIKRSLSQTLTHFPPLAGRLITDSDGYVYISCNDAGADFTHATATHIFVRDVIGSIDVPDHVKELFAFDRTVSYQGHFKPLLAVQVTELADGVFISCSVNHAVIDGTSLWNFFNSFAEVTRGVKRITRLPDFSRDSVLISPVVLKIPDGGPKVTFSLDSPLRERIFCFSRESILRLKDKTNNNPKWNMEGEIDIAELMGKQSNDPLKISDSKLTPLTENLTSEISSFQSLCALLWRAVTRARKFHASKMTTFRMAVNCRHRLQPKLLPLYFGNAIQSIPTYASAGDVLSHDLLWCAEQLNKNVKAHGNAMVRKYVEDWESDPRCFPLGNFDGAMLTMGSSPRFPMYDNDFGWGRPIVVRSGRANKFDGKISAFPGRKGGGSVDLEVVLAPETMDGLESDPEFAQFVAGN
ncbi:BAHD acyltransferase DCR-like [Lycium ferocissimum]|uniref:BAHD acyltransferase DCR-like n=1 Tax=Lycium ferocissimum TaxID=112874 RepID=UPI0028169F32|nr:BAHD acyltransferase DCR-like [Lycium ferocissimum]